MKKHPDSVIIEELGGGSKLAKMLGYTLEGGRQRINNWRLRGIPNKVILENPAIFRKYFKQLK